MMMGIRNFLIVHKVALILRILMYYLNLWKFLGTPTSKITSYT